MSIHPNIESIIDDEYLLRAVRGGYSKYGRSLNNTVRYCIECYNRCLRGEAAFLKGTGIILNHAGLYILISKSLYHSYINTSNYDTNIIFINAQNFAPTNKSSRGSYHLFGFRDLDIYIMVKENSARSGNLDGARKFLSAMHYLADDLECGVGNKIYRVE